LYSYPPTLSIAFGKKFGRFLIKFLNAMLVKGDPGPLFPLAVFVDTRSFSFGRGSLARCFVITGHLSI
jgi:hypothetical protein